MDKFIVKWEGCWLAPFGFASSDESRTHDKDHAMIFHSIRSAQLRIARIRKFRPITNYEILKLKGND